MTNRVLTTEADREGFAEWLLTQPLPVTVSVRKGKHRTDRQNRLQRKWMEEIAEQLKERGVFPTPEDVRGHCKLHFGVPIMREDPAFRDGYDKIIKPLSYESKIEIMKEPLDFSVTRLMTTEQKTRYLDAIAHHFAEQGVRLTHPDDRGR